MYLQDSLVVCRVRKNSEFRTNGSQRHLSTGHKYAISDQTNPSEREQGIECSSNRYSSSNDNSYSTEQLDPASGSDQKLSMESIQAESSDQVVQIF